MHALVFYRKSGSKDGAPCLTERSGRAVRFEKMQHPAQREQIRTAAGGEIFPDEFLLQRFDFFSGGAGAVLQQLSSSAGCFLLGRQIASCDEIGIRRMRKDGEQDRRACFICTPSLG